MYKSFMYKSLLYKSLFRGFIFITACIVNGSLYAAFTHDPSLSWKTLHTPHFNVHYHDDAESLAKETAEISERVHQRLSKYFAWTPLAPTEIVLTDRMDFSNGWAYPWPRNTMTIIVSPPDDVGVLDDYDNWLELLILHEYAHVLHVDMATGFPGLMRDVFGRSTFPFFFAFPNAYQPPWILEGLATYIETDERFGIGRGQSNSFKTLMRLEVANGVKPIRQINQPMVSWPTGTARYLYGVYFMNFIKERYGDQRLRNWIIQYSDNVFWYI